MNIKVKTAVFYTIIMLILAVVITLIALNAVNKSAIISKNKPTYHSSQYIVKSYQGKIAVFLGENTSPEKVVDVYIKSLPIKDRELLEKGIYAESKSEVNSILEDFDG